MIHLHHLSPSTNRVPLDLLRTSIVLRIRSVTMKKTDKTLPMFWAEACIIMGKEEGGRGNNTQIKI